MSDDIQTTQQLAEATEKLKAPRAEIKLLPLPPVRPLMYSRESPRKKESLNSGPRLRV